MKKHNKGIQCYGYMPNLPVTTEGEFPSSVVWLLGNMSVILSFSVIGDWALPVGGAVDGLTETGFCEEASVLTAVLLSSSKDHILKCKI